jgi:hypothetical protein
MLKESGECFGLDELVAVLGGGYVGGMVGGEVVLVETLFVILLKLIPRLNKTCIQRTRALNELFFCSNDLALSLLQHEPVATIMAQANVPARQLSVVLVSVSNDVFT